MEIILMRHGKPVYTSCSKVSSLEMAEWISRYDLSDTGSDLPPGSSKTLALSASHILSSPLPRALSSLNALGRKADLIDDVFREAGLPVFHLPALRLPPGYWAALFRVLWLCGISRNAEPRGIAQQRAAQAAKILVTSVKASNGPVLLMGHGMMNNLIARELVSLGWKACRRQGNGYWTASIYRLA